MYLSVPVAYVIDIFGKLLSAASYLFFKLAHHQQEQESGVSNVKAYTTWTWLIGLACIILGSVINLLMLQFCPLVLLSTNVCFELVFSNVIAIRFLGEKMVWKYDLTALLLLIVGCLGIVLLS